MIPPNNCKYYNIASKLFQAEATFKSSFMFTTKENPDSNFYTPSVNTDMWPFKKRTLNWP